MLLGKGADPVLRRFQFQFIVVVMAFVAVLLLAVLVVASTMTHAQREADVRNALDARSDRMHLMPIDLMLGDLHFLHEYGLDMDIEYFTENERDVLNGPGEPGMPGESGGKRNPGEFRNAGDDPLVATSAYLLDEDGDIQLTISNSLALDSSTVEEAIDDIRGHLELNEEKVEIGKIPTLNLYYQLRDYDNGYTVVLASGNYVDRALQSIVRTLASIEAVAFLLLLGLSIVLSRWVVGPIERAWTQQRQFIADASHELKTPLTVIRANNSLLMADPSASVASQMQWIESTETEATLMQDLVNDMLVLAQSENEQSEVVHTELDLSELVQGSVLQFESVAFERGIMLESSVEPQVIVKGIEKDLGRLVGTLIDNACKYANAAGSVDVRLWKQGSSCYFRVTNSGDAIPDEDIPHVFDRFYRSDKARTRETGGFGLGLAIAKNIAEEHKGSIAVASEAGSGTAFTVTLPLQ